MVRTIALLAAALALVLGGCVRRTSSAGRVRIGAREERQLRQQSSREMGCPGAGLTLTPLSDRVWQVHGCGQLRDYAMATGRRRGWYPLTPVYVRASTEMACPLEQLQVAAPTPTLRSASGCGRSARYDLVCGAIECAWMMTAHSGAWAGETSPQVVAAAGPTIGPTAEPATSPSAAPAIAEGALAEGTTASGTTASPPPAGTTSGDELAIPEPPAAGSAEAVLRAALDAQRAGIHRCAGMGVVPVHAAWSADGTVTLALEPPLAGTTAEACVRAAVGAQRVPAGAAGEIVHPVL